MNGALKNIKQIINPVCSSITKEELFNQLFSQAIQKFAIEPEPIIIRQNNGDLIQALHKSQQFAQRTLQQHIDTGTLELDRVPGSNCNVSTSKGTLAAVTPLPCLPPAQSPQKPLALHSWA